MMVFAFSFISYINFLEFFKNGNSRMYIYGMIAEATIGALIVSKASLYYERYNIFNLNDFVFYILFFGIPILISRFFFIRPLAKKNSV